MRLVAALCLLLLLAGCDKSVDVGTNYKITAPFSPDGQNHGNTLLYKDKKVCDNVVMQSFRGDTLVFATGVRNSTDLQLMAVRSAGPPVILSERVLGRSFASNWPPYQLWSIAPAGDGFDVKFFVGVDSKTSGDVYQTQHLSWAQIRSLLDEADRSATLTTAREGTFRFLAMLPGATTQP